MAVDFTTGMVKDPSIKTQSQLRGNPLVIMGILQDGNPEGTAVTISPSALGGGGGTAGATGAQGIQGVQGRNGLQGIQGFNGFQGVQGNNGLQGMQGPKGDGGANVDLDKVTSDVLDKLKEYLQPIGTIMVWGGRELPSDSKMTWMWCHGQSLTKSSYDALFGVLSYQFGGSGSNFNLPDFRGRFLVGKEDNNNNGYGTLNNSGGENKHTLTIQEMPSHDHGVTYNNWKAGDNANRRDMIESSSNEKCKTTKSGGGQAHENRPPFRVIDYIIRVK